MFSYLAEIKIDCAGSFSNIEESCGKIVQQEVRFKDFGVGDLVWKVILPIGSKNPKCGKWSPT